ncbi:PEP-CTERM sorting domain-containing protein [Denitromonas halophila]|uniref:Ice-binding protein C-terminal domain-containing protein n=1 Tax=Denitromonas halophila TaxID=1629404 RepID=A0A557R0U9_9RHOO|nr:PEP-CTERM sorting domain-containing protein [Denitromonas halophila]TVO58782.1 hypothetical protein FHP91_03720 [Denitromonas halophila]
MFFARRATLPLALIALCLTSVAHAAGTAVRGPSTAAADASEVVTQYSGFIDLNPARSAVSTVHGYDSVTSISVDTDNGIIKGYAEFDLPTDSTLPLSATVGSAVQGSLSSPLTFFGGTGPQTVTAELRFDGSFDALRGLPTFSLTGNITATSFTAIPFTQSLYQSQLTFLMSAVTPTYVPQVLTLGHESQTAGGVTTDTPFYAGATQVAVDASATSLDAIVRLSFDVMPGQAYNISSFVNGLVTAEPGSNQTATHGDLLSSAGVLDFSHTAQLALYVPQGVTVVGDPLIHQIVVTAVPEPQAAGMLLAGLVLVAGIARRRRVRG